MTTNILIAYYSRSGNTERIASLIHQQAGGTLHRIVPERAYPASYNATVDQAKQEIRAGVHPPLRNALESITGFDALFIGSPNWWSTIAPPVATFLASYDLAGKTIAPFCTHGGGGLGKIHQDITGACPHSNVMTPLVIYGSGGSQAAQDVAAWLSTISP
jgi:flavodoxin